MKLTDKVENLADVYKNDASLIYVNRNVVSVSKPIDTPSLDEIIELCKHQGNLQKLFTKIKKEGMTYSYIQELYDELAFTVAFYYDKYYQSDLALLYAKQAKANNDFSSYLTCKTKDERFEAFLQHLKVFLEYNVKGRVDNIRYFVTDSGNNFAHILLALYHYIIYRDLTRY